MALREMLAQFSIAVDGLDQLDKVDKKLDKLKGLADGSWSSAFSVFGGLATLASGAVIAMVPGLVKAGNEIDKVSDRLGLSAEELQRWRYMAEQTGASATDLTLAVKFLYRNLADAASGGAAGKQFAKLGISVRDAGGNVKTAEEAMGDLADAVGKAKSDAEKAGIALHFLGKGGIALLPLLKGGREQVERLTKRFKELGGGFSNEFVRDAAAAKTAFIDLSYAGRLLKDHIGVQLLPVVTWVTNKLADLSVVIGHVVHNTQTLRTVMLGAGVASGITAIKLGAGIASKLGLVEKLAEGASRGIVGTVGAFGQLVKAGLSLGLKLALIFLIAEDLFSLFMGGNSVIGAFIDAMFGVGASAAFVAGLKDVWVTLVEVIKLALPYVQWFAKQTALFLKDLFSGFKGYGQMFSEFFEFLWKDIKGFFSNIGTELFDKVISLYQKLRDNPIVGPILKGALGAIGIDMNSTSTATTSARPSTGNNVNQNNTTTIDVTAPDPVTAAKAVATGQKNTNADYVDTLQSIIKP